MVKVIYKTTRPTANSLFFPSSKAVDLISSQAKAGGHLLKDYMTFSNDRLTRTYTAIWLNNDCLEEFKRNTAIVDFFRMRGWYEQENEHIQSIITIEVDCI
jgi:hypothetical protein